MKVNIEELISLIAEELDEDLDEELDFEEVTTDLKNVPIGVDTLELGDNSPPKGASNPWAIKKENKIKLSRHRIMEIINEELDRAEVMDEDRGSISNMEIEELLRNYFHRNPIPEDINRLSVIFPILDKAGLTSVTEKYKELAGTQGRERALAFLGNVREVIQKIKSSKGD